MISVKEYKRLVNEERDNVFNNFIKSIDKRIKDTVKSQETTIQIYVDNITPNMLELLETAYTKAGWKFEYRNNNIILK